MSNHNARENYAPSEISFEPALVELLNAGNPVDNSGVRPDFMYDGQETPAESNTNTKRSVINILTGGVASLFKRGNRSKQLEPLAPRAITTPTTSASRIPASATGPRSTPLPPIQRSMAEVARGIRVTRESVAPRTVPTPGEQHWVNFHQMTLVVLKPMQVEPTGLKSLSRTVYRLGASPPYITAFSNAYGTDINSGVKVDFKLCPTVVPFHIASGFALASNVINGIIFEELYAKYTSRISSLIDIITAGGEDPLDYIDYIKAIVENHSKNTTILFLTEFYLLYSNEGFYKDDISGAHKTARSWLNGLIIPINTAIKNIENHMRAKMYAAAIRVRTHAEDGDGNDNADE